MTSETSSVIVYRSRTEQAIDTALWDGSLVPIAAAVLAFFVVIFVITKIFNSRPFYDKFRQHRWIWKFESQLTLSLAAVAAWAAFKITFNMVM